MTLPIPFALIPAHSPAPGAVEDPDGPGPMPTLHEADLSRRLCSEISDLVPGSRVASSPTRDHRRLETASWAPCVALEPHWNAGAPGDYGAVFYAPGSPGGKRAAEVIARGLRALGVPGYRVICEPADPARWPGPAACLAYTSHTPAGHVGVLLEVAFLSNPAHAWFATNEGITAVAAVIAAALEVK